MRKNVKKPFLSIIIVLFLGYFLIIAPVFKIKKEAKALITSAKELKFVFSKNDMTLLKTKMNSFSDQYKHFEKTSKSIYWLSFIPYVSDYRNGVEAGGFMVKAGVDGVAAIEPYADLIGFKKGETSFVEKSAEDRLQTAVLTLDKLVKQVDPISKDIELANERIAKVNPKRYPGKLGRTNVRSQIENVKEQFAGMSSFFVDAKPLIKKLPELLGSKEEKTYLLLYQNDKERRATGGFLTFYAVMKINGGKITIASSNDIYSLDATINERPKTPTEILTYHKDVNVFYIRDSNLSPDFPESVKLFESLYQNSGAKVKYDGIIAMDSKILVDMLTIFGDTDVNGITFSAKNDKRCDCPEAIYTLFDIVDRPVNYIKTDRKGILGDLMYSLFYKAIGYSPSKYWGTLMQTMYKNMEEKHILLYFIDKEVQKSVEQVNFAGRINEYKGDYLHINNVNFAGAKANMFVSEEIESITKGKDRKVTVDFKNPYPHSDCNLERGGLCLNATLRNWIRIYVPEGSTLVEFKGSQKKVQTYDDLGKTVFEGYLEVPTQGKATVIVKYKLPKDVSTDSMLIQKQPGVTNQEWIVRVNNKKVFDGILKTDQKIMSK